MKYTYTKIPPLCFLALVFAVALIGCSNRYINIETEGNSQIDTSCGTSNEKPSRSVKLGASLFDFYQDEDVLAFQDGFYENMPISAEVRIDKGGGTNPVTTDDAEQIRRLFEAMKKVEVVRKTSMSVTDNYHYVCFSMSDGRLFFFTFEGEWLSNGNQNYILSNSKEFWTVCKKIVNQ